jgi:hypothetical protein
MRQLSEIHFGDTTARFVTDAGGRLGLILFPTKLVNSLSIRRPTLSGEPFIDALPDTVAPPAIAVDSRPAVEQDLPIVFNEWCTTWGSPRHERVVRLADRSEGTPVN